jgi:predicted DNA-binding transcriptional regulator AlpA
LDADELGRVIGKSRGWIDHNMCDLPAPLRVGGERRWSEREIQRWIRSCPRWDGGGR